MTVYVSRDAGGAITGVYANLQSGVAEEAIDDQVAEVQAYLHPDAATLYARLIAAAKSLFIDTDVVASRVERAAALVTLDRVNATDLTLTDLFAAIAAATSLADLKTRAAAISVPPQFTAAQIKIAIANKIDSSNSD